MEFRKIEDLEQLVYVPEGTIGVVAEAGAVGVGILVVYHIIFPNRPLVPASLYPDGLRVIARKLTILSPGESFPIRSAGIWTTRKEIVTNCDGRAKIERRGLLRQILGPAARYKSAPSAPTPRS